MNRPQDSKAVLEIGHIPVDAWIMKYEIGNLNFEIEYMKYEMFLNIGLGRQYRIRLVVACSV